MTSLWLSKLRVASLPYDPTVDRGHGQQIFPQDNSDFRLPEDIIFKIYKIRRNEVVRIREDKKTLRWAFLALA